MPPNNDQTDISKILSKIYKLQSNQDNAHQEEYALLKENLDQMNVLLGKLTSSMSTNINIAEGQKTIPYSKSNIINTVQSTKPSNPDSYTEIINVYAENGSRPVQHMTIVNDGPGNIYFVTAHAKIDISTQEVLLSVNDQRELFNVYEVRLRVTLPLTSYRLVEGVFRTGSFAPQTKANVEVRPSIQSNQLLKDFTMAFDNTLTTATFDSPITQDITVDFTQSSVRPPLPRGQTAVYVDSVNNSPMPATIPAGFQAELFGLFTNFNTDFTARGYLELTPGTDIYIPTVIEPCSPRGLHINNSPNLFFFSSAGMDPDGAPSPGRKFVVAITNDDPFNSMIGSSDLIIVYSRIT